MRGFLSVLLVMACTVLPAEGACAESLEPPAPAGNSGDDDLAPSLIPSFIEIRESEAGGIRMKRIGGGLLSLFSVDIARSRIERSEATEEFPPTAR